MLARAMTWLPFPVSDQFRRTRVAITASSAMRSRRSQFSVWIRS
jgi:hypothetical protein